MPFKLGKVRIVSSSEGVDKAPGENKWSFDINQNNDFYIYIERNNKYNKQEAIKSIVIDNINVQKIKKRSNKFLLGRILLNKEEFLVIPKKI